MNPAFSKMGLRYFPVVCLLLAMIQGVVHSEDSMQNDLGTNTSSLVEGPLSKKSDNGNKIQAIQDDSEENKSERDDLAKRQLQAKRSKAGAGIVIPSKESVDDIVLELAKSHLIKMIIDERANVGKIQQSIQTLQRDNCSPLTAVALPVTHNTRQLHQGAWMKDPLGIMGCETIFVMESYVGRNIVEEFENMDNFKAGIVRKKHTLPYRYDGTGAVVYGPYLYYNRENSPYVVKFNLKSNKLEAQIHLGGFQQRRNGYRWCGGYCAVDLAVDEQGLWALWGDSDNSRRLYAQKIDVFKNVVIQTYALSTETMRTMGNAFVACGIIYTIDEYSPVKTRINFAYDTKTRRTWNPNIEFTNQYCYNSMVAYNPREKVLYAWDAKRQVTYSLTFDEQS